VRISNSTPTHRGRPPRKLLTRNTTTTRQDHEMPNDRATELAANPLDLARHLITYNPATDEPIFASSAKPAVLKPIPWPQGLAPQPIISLTHDEDPVPQADVLIVTYTVAEGYALADILTPGVTSREWHPYRNNWPAIKALIEGGRAPALEADCAGYWAVTKIGDITAVLVKSELHPSTDGPHLPIVTAWQQWIEQVQPKLVITTGTAGAVQETTQLGDVVVSCTARWDCEKQFKNQTFAGNIYYSPSTAKPDFTIAEQLIAPNAAELPSAWCSRPPKVWTDSPTSPAHVVTTDFFAFDDAENTYGLRSVDPNARVVEMDDAALPLAMLGISKPPPWLSVRNASDPQMPGADLATQTKQAAGIYEKYGQITSWGSAIACWAICTQITP
jgi:nucleoside phosphorylase